METKKPSSLEEKVAEMRKYQLAAADLFAEIVFKHQNMLDNMASTVGHNNKRLGSVINVQKQLRQATEEQEARIERNEQALLGVASETIDTTLRAEETENMPQVSASATATPPSPVTPPTPIVRQLPTARILLVVGHNAIIQGAYSKHLQQSEYEFNLALARSLEGSYDNNDNITDINSDNTITNAQISILYRESNITREEFMTKHVSTTSRLRNFDLIIEMHFNAFNDTSVSGMELLHSSEDYRDVKLFQTLLLGMSDIMRNRYRGDKKLQQGARGYYNVTALRNDFGDETPYCLVEPFFGSNKEDSELAANKLYAAYYNGIMKVATEIGQRKLAKKQQQGQQQQQPSKQGTV